MFTAAFHLLPCYTAIKYNLTRQAYCTLKHTQALHMQRKLTNNQLSLAHDIKVKSQQINDTEIENAKQKESKKQ